MLEENMEIRNCSCNCENDCMNMNNNTNDNSCACQNEIRQEMLMSIKSYKFSIVELGLYLDTHPDDEKALCLHREYTKKLRDLEDNYQKMFGPLTINYPCKKWRWLEEPWPWERGSF